jgi:hypothetical protein
MWTRSVTNTGWVRPPVDSSISMTTFNGLRPNHRGQADSSQLDDNASRWKNIRCNLFLRFRRRIYDRSLMRLGACEARR